MYLIAPRWRRAGLTVYHEGFSASMLLSVAHKNPISRGGTQTARRQLGSCERGRTAADLLVKIRPDEDTGDGRELMIVVEFAF